MISIAVVAYSLTVECMSNTKISAKAGIYSAPLLKLLIFFTVSEKVILPNKNHNVNICMSELI
jgi:hypothetical protein